jgi:hypothetical protein
VADAWKDWWRKRGEERLSLLLWALWNPIGPVPPDEYDNYTGRVVSVLRKAYEADIDVGAYGIPSTADQLQRNALSAASVAELAGLLGRLSAQQMEVAPDPDTDYRTAETLLDWYAWEMNALLGS